MIGPGKISRAARFHVARNAVGVVDGKRYADESIREAVIRYGSGDASRTTPLYVQYSLDGTTWTTAFNPTVGNQVDTDIILPTPVRARYWRIFQHYSNGSTVVASKFPNILIYYYEPGLVFTNPPADGAAIEMDCQLDRPIKNENWVLDFSCAIQFARG